MYADFTLRQVDSMPSLLTNEHIGGKANGRYISDYLSLFIVLYENYHIPVRV